MRALRTGRDLRHPDRRLDRCLRAPFHRRDAGHPLRVLQPGGDPGRAREALRAADRGRAGEIGTPQRRRPPVPPHGPRDEAADARRASRCPRRIHAVLGVGKMARRSASHGGGGIAHAGPVRRPARVPRLPARLADAPQALRQGPPAHRRARRGRQDVALRRRSQKGASDRLARDPGAAKHFVAPVEHRGLSRRDPKRGLAQAHAHVSAGQGLDLRRQGFATMADLHFAGRTRPRRLRYPAGRARAKRAPRRLLAGADDDALARSVEGRDVERKATRDPQPLALPDGEAVHAVVVAEDATLYVDDLSARAGYAVRLEEVSYGSAGYEARLHALGLVRVREAVLARQRPHLGLRQLAEGKADEAQLGLGEAVQEIALVLAGVASAKEPIAAIRPFFDACVMAGGERRRAEAPCAVEEPLELDLVVAADAGIVRLASRVTRDEVVYHLGAEPRCRVVDVEPDAEDGGGAATVVEVRRSAAGTPAPLRLLGRRVQPQRDAAHRVGTLLLREESRGGGRIDAPAHRYDRQHGEIVSRALWK